jgi:hypothetical protein
MSRPQMISVNEAVTLIATSKGKFFTASFVKRSDNSLRTMNCRVGVKKGLKKESTSKKRRNAGLVTVYDMTNRGYRNINVSGLRRLRIFGKEYQVV